ncbi:MAG: hypothetical protein DYG87_00705 [Anaerolineae bacterium CFX3]|nr:hypothetical protein [Anaerolineae bacterium CFX3]
MNAAYSPSASCPPPPAFCLPPPAFCLPPPAFCLPPPAFCLPPPAFPPASRLLLSAFCLLTLFLASCAPASPAPQAAPIHPTEAPPVVFENHEAFLLSMEENGYAHFFLYSLDGRLLLRLTDGNWSDVAPSLSPDGQRIAFASNRSGYWDIYTLVLASGEVTQVTNTSEYDSSPTWSPDGQWLAYETYNGGNLEIAASQLTAPENPPVFLTGEPSADVSPAWAPQGRQIAFVSDRSGSPEIWLADLDRPDEGRYTDVSNTPASVERRPSWAGSRLLWVTEAEGVDVSGAYVWDAGQPDRAARWIADADWAAWSPAADKIVTVVRGPNEDYLSASSLDGGLILPPVRLPGLVRGLLWLTVDLSNPPAAYRAASEVTPAALWSPTLFPLAEGPSGRGRVVTLPEVQAPYPQLQDAVDESFAALRERVVAAAGWDALASLQNAYVPLTSPLDPGLGNDWLYTGRAFALNSLLVNAGWMVAAREEVGRQTFWRIYLRAQNQDGSQGAPLNESPWDLNARYSLDPQAYDRGGAYTPIPPGYWVDFTALARAYGWERQPSLPNWRVYIGGTRFTEFVLTDGLDWPTAMLELYPPEILITPTLRLPPTLTPTRTPVPTFTRGPSPTPTNTLTPTSTPQPTFTFTPTVTATPEPSNTPLP